MLPPLAERLLIAAAPALREAGWARVELDRDAGRHAMDVLEDVVAEVDVAHHHRATPGLDLARDEAALHEVTGTVESLPQPLGRKRAQPLGAAGRVDRERALEQRWRLEGAAGDHDEVGVARLERAARDPVVVARDVIGAPAPHPVAATGARDVRRLAVYEHVSRPVACASAR